MANTKKQVKLIGAFDLFQKSYQLFMENLQLFSLLFLLPLAATVATTFFVKPADFSSLSSLGGSQFFSGFILFRGIAVIFTILILIVFIMLQALLHGLQLEVARGKTPTFADIWEIGKKYWLRLFGLSIVVAIVTVIGFILLIIPGLIMLRRYYLAPFVMIDRDVSVLEAMRISAAISKPYSWWVWSILGVTVLLEVPGLVPVVGPFITFILTSIYSIAPALRYQELKKLVKVTSL